MENENIKMYIEDIKKLKDVVDINEIITEINKIYKGLTNKDFGSTNDYVEQVIIKHTNNGDFNGIINVYNYKALKQKNNFQPYILTEAENCINVLKALIKVVIKKVLTSKGHDILKINFGEDISLIYDIFVGLMNLK